MDGLVSAEEIKEGLQPARRAIACILDTLCSARESITSLENTHAVWVALSEPGITLCDYALRLLTYMHCSPSCLIVSIIYIDRLIQLNGNISIHTLTIHRLLLAAMVVAAKYWDDEFYKNSYYARVGGLPIGELNKLEADFCFELNFELHIDPELFAHYFHELVKHPTSSRCPRCNPSVEAVAVIGRAPVTELQELPMDPDDVPMDPHPKPPPKNSLRPSLSPIAEPRIHIPAIRFSESVQTRRSREELAEDDLNALRRHTASFNRHSSHSGFRILATQELLAAAHAYSAAGAFPAAEQKTAPTAKECTKGAV
jgi:hypothetical protein